MIPPPPASPPPLPRAPVHIDSSEYFGAGVIALLAGGFAAVVTASTSLTGAFFLGVCACTFALLVRHINGHARHAPATFPTVYWSEDGKYWWDGRGWCHRDDPELARFSGHGDATLSSNPDDETYVAEGGKYQWNKGTWSQSTPRHTPSRRGGLVVAVVFGWLLTLGDLIGAIDPAHQSNKRSIGSWITMALFYAALSAWGTVVIVRRGRGPRVHQLLWPPAHRTVCSHCGGPLTATSTECAYCGYLVSAAPIDQSNNNDAG